MQTQTNLAEVRFCAQGVSLYGAVLRMNTQEITLRLAPQPGVACLLAPGNPAELVVVAQNTVFLAQTTVARNAENALTLAFQGGTRKINIRQHTRHVCELPVTFRPIHADGSAGVWRNGVTLDISMGGMGLLVAGGSEVPSRLEALFTPPLEDNEDAPLPAADANGELRPQNDNRLGSAHSPDRNRPIKVSAVINNQKRLTDGQVALGLSFGKIPPMDQIRLARFIGDPLMHTTLPTYARNKSGTE